MIVAWQQHSHAKTKPKKTKHLLQKYLFPMSAHQSLIGHPIVFGDQRF